MNWFIKLSNLAPINPEQFMKLFNAAMSYNLQSNVKRQTGVYPNIKSLLEKYKNNPNEITLDNFRELLPEEIIQQIINS